MALIKATLENDLKQVFSDMKSAGENASDDDFASGIAKACADFVKSGTVITIDAGTVSSGVFAGSGNGSVSVEASLMENSLKSACSAMKNMTEGGDAVLASAIATGFVTMTTAGQVETDIVGATTSPAGFPVPPTNGKGKGTIICQPASILGSLTSAFNNMKNMTDGGDDVFASELASAIDTCVKAGVIVVNGQGALSGTIGSGTIS